MTCTAHSFCGIFLFGFCIVLEYSASHEYSKDVKSRIFQGCYSKNNIEEYFKNNNQEYIKDVISRIIIIKDYFKDVISRIVLKNISRMFED